MLTGRAGALKVFTQEGGACLSALLSYVWLQAGSLVVFDEYSLQRVLQRCVVFLLRAIEREQVHSQQ